MKTIITKNIKKYHKAPCTSSSKNQYAIVIIIIMDMRSHVLGHSGVDKELNQKSVSNSIEHSCDNSVIGSHEHSLIPKASLNTYFWNVFGEPQPKAVVTPLRVPSIINDR